MQDPETALTRRHALAGLTGCGAAAFAQAAFAQDKAPPGGRVAFDVWRNGDKIGTHSVRFQGRPCSGAAIISARMLVKVGPVPLFHYSHDAVETWEGGQFVGLRARSVTGGKVEILSAMRGADGVQIVRPGGATLLAAANTLPMTHWNRDAFKGPLFNPQTGALLRASVARVGGDGVKMADGSPVACSGYRMTGDADITDWYDTDAVWSALKGKGPDGSTIEYRRTV